VADHALEAIEDAIAADDGLWQDFVALCDCGGRRAGTQSEARALDWAHGRLARIAPSARLQAVSYAGWRIDAQRLALDDGTPLDCHALLGAQFTAPEGLRAEVVDVGRGVPEDFERHRARIAGRIVLVRHEYPFSTTHIHRRRKYNWAIERGAAAFLIASPEPGMGPVSGSSGRGGGAGIPAAGVSYETAARIAALPHARVVLTLRGEDFPGRTRIAVLDLPGRSAERVALSAHLDGHDLAESAMDNASGVATVLALARAFAPHLGECRRGLRVCLFSAEEWALAGSRDYLDAMDEAERRSIVLNVNLDTVSGGARLTALTSEFAELPPLVRAASADSGIDVGIHEPMMSNSDHYNFARHGIPALRLVAGFDDAACNVRHILTQGDTREKVSLAEMRAAARYAAALVWRGLQ
jgi:hypothetical protein